jgi:hypothetical protein
MCGVRREGGYLLHCRLVEISCLRRLTLVGPHADQFFEPLEPGSVLGTWGPLAPITFCDHSFRQASLHSTAPPFMATCIRCVLAGRHARSLVRLPSWSTCSLTRPPAQLVDTCAVHTLLQIALLTKTLLFCVACVVLSATAELALSLQRSAHVLVYFFSRQRGKRGGDSVVWGEGTGW